jgi:exosortase
MFREILDEFLASLATTWGNLRAIPRSSQLMILLFCASIVFLGVSYYFALTIIVDSWGRVEYDWGALIPILAIILFWMKRESFKAASLWEQATGFAIILIVSLVCRQLLWLKYTWMQFMLYSIIPFLGGLILMLGGWKMVKWTLPGMILLTFAIPFSSKMERFTFSKLQDVATTSSVYTAETLGIDINQTGNQITLYKDGKDLDLNVAEVCAGFRSMLTLLSLSLFAAFILPGELWIKIVMVASSIPIALTSNIVRIVCQCLAYLIDNDFGEYFHNYLAGFVMFPIMIGLMYLEYVILKNLVIEEGDVGSIKVQPITSAPLKQVIKPMPATPLTTPIKR